jgi:hypothetical protein
MNWRESEKRALSGRFISEPINKYIIENTIDRIEYDDEQIYITSFIIKGIKAIKIKECHDLLIERTKYFCDITKNNKKVVLYWFPTEYKKILPIDKKSLDVHEINSACTWHNGEESFIAIYRWEEAPKVLFHELSHYFHLDEYLTHNDNDYFITKYNLDIPCSLAETYSEIIGFIMNIFHFTNGFNELFDKMFAVEMAFSVYQCQKILRFFNINNSGDLHKLKSDTNLFTYYILKTIFIYNINPREFLEKMLNKTNPLVLEGEHLDNFNNIIKNIDHIFEIEKIPIINGLEKTMRMTIVDYSPDL